MRRILIFLTAFLTAPLILFSGCTRSEPEKAEIYTYEKQEISMQCIIPGKIVSAEDITDVETTLTQCNVKEVYVNIGDTVRAGDKICMLDISEIEKQITELQKEIKNTENKNNVDLKHYENELAYAKNIKVIELEKIQDEIDYQQKIYDEATTNYTNTVAEYDKTVIKSEEYKVQLDSATNEEEMDAVYQKYMTFQQQAEEYRQSVDSYSQIMKEAEQQLMTLRNSYDSTKKQCDHNIELAQLELDSFKLGITDTNETKLTELKKQLTEAVIYAPCDGSVSNLTVQEGKPCIDGVVAEIVESSDMRLKVPVTDEYILFIDEGETVTFLSSAMNDRIYEGKVKKISNIKGEEGYDVYVDIADTSELLDGMTANVTFTLKSVNSYAVPTSAISSDAEGNQIVYTLEAMEDGSYKTKSHIISTGIANQSYIEIIDSDIQKGTMIVLNPELYQDGQTLVPDEQRVTE